MLTKIATIGAVFLCCSSSYALDLQREELLNLYHGVDSEQISSSSALADLSNGLAAHYQQGNERDEIQFAPLSEPKREYEFKTPTQFGHNETESVGVFIKQSF